MKHKMVAVFCGSNLGTLPVFEETALRLADVMIEQGLGLVYGGGSRGLMGVVAKRMHEAGSPVIGVSPRRFHKEGQKIPSSEYLLVDTMHQRKELMYKKADAFLALPGGIGTLEEISEIFAWNTIGFTGKPVGILNVNGFYDPFLQQLKVIEEYGFIPFHQMDRLIVKTTPSSLIAALTSAPLIEAPWEADSL